jgi:Rieske Fe-S protein
MGSLDSPIPRRRALVMIGGGIAVAGVGSVLQACSAAPAASPTWVALDVDPATLPVDVPTEVPLTVTTGDGTVHGSTWLVRGADGTVTAFDARCTHAGCGYAWSEDDVRFACFCHAGYFARDGSVISGPPPRPLERYPTRTTAAGLEVEVGAGFATPRPDD